MSLTGLQPATIDPTVVSGTARDIFVACCNALDEKSIEDFPKRFISPGSEVAFDDSGMLVVTFTRVFMGRSGQEQFQQILFGDGQAGQNVAEFAIQMSMAVPVLKPGPISGQPGLDIGAMEQYTLAANALMIGAWTVWSTLLNLAWRNQLLVSSGQQRKSLLGPVMTGGPGGGLAKLGFLIQADLV